MEGGREIEVEGLKIRSMRELVWRAERLGYQRQSGAHDNVDNLIKFIASKTSQSVSLDKIEPEEDPAEFDRQLKEKERLRKEARKQAGGKPTTPFSATAVFPRMVRRDSNPFNPNAEGNISQVVKGLINFSPQRKSTLTSGKRQCCICMDSFSNAEGFACGNGHFACLDCQSGWLEVRLAEYNVALQCCTLATCPSAFHPTTFFSLLKNEDLKKKWEQTTLDLWRKKEAQKQNKERQERRASFSKEKKKTNTLLIEEEDEEGEGGEDEKEDEDEEIWVDCINCTYYELATRRSLKELGGIFECKSCGVVSCHLCEPVTKVGATMDQYAYLADAKPHVHTKDLRYLWRSKVEGIITKASLPSCPECGFLASKEVGCNALQCPSCSTRFCFVCSLRLPQEGAKAHDAYNSDNHHNPKLRCMLFEKDDSATNKKACRLIRQAFMRDKELTHNQLMLLCGDMLRSIEFTFDSPEYVWECCCM